MNKNKYLLFFSSVGVLLLLVVAAVSENFFKEWHGIQAEAKTQDGPIEEHLRQIVNPALKTADRCVTCHVGMAPGEQITSPLKVASVHKPVVHDPTVMGCTTCHGGQGAATTKEDAHGEVEFWTEPMLPSKYAYAGCGSCHTPLNVPDLPIWENARNTFEKLDCYACHRVEGRGGTLRVGGEVTGMEGPDLSGVGIKGYNADWYASHILKSSQDGVWKNSFSEISESDLAAVKIFLDTEMGASKLTEARAQFNTVGCTGCHKVGNFGGDAGVDLSQSGFKDPNQLDFSAVSGKHTLSNWIAAHFRSPQATVKGSQMPVLGLSEKQIDLLTMYVLSLRRRTLPDVYLPKDRVKAMRFGAREFATDGETIYSAVCSSCHSATGNGNRFPALVPNPSITNPDFLELASDDFIYQTIYKGRTGTPMLAWGERENGLTEQEIRGVVAYIRQLGGNVQFKPDMFSRVWATGDPNNGKRLFAANCAGCHGKTGEGLEGPAIGSKPFLDAASDTYLTETISRGRRGTIMQGFNNSSIVRRALTPAEIQSIVVYLRSLGNK
ncbi:MAG: c-type cytochrome [Pyrinomonadaceae bacterium]